MMLSIREILFKPFIFNTTFTICPSFDKRIPSHTRWSSYCLKKIPQKDLDFVVQCPVSQANLYQKRLI